MQKTVVVSHVTKQYGKLIAVKDVSFEIERGEIFGLLGPNGAGKTTTIEMMEGLRRPDSGSIKIYGLDPIREGNKLREQIGVQLEVSSLYSKIKVKEALDLFSSFYQRPSDIKSLLRMMSLERKANSYFKELSHGQKQRLAITLALINDPKILFFDEATIGLDPQARRKIWTLMKKIRTEGKTIILTTHYMEEAERLCDRVAIIDRGEIVALGTPNNLIANLGQQNKVEFYSEGNIELEELKRIDEVNNVEKIERKYVLYSDKPYDVLRRLIQLEKAENYNLQNLYVNRVTLEDVFLAFT